MNRQELQRRRRRVHKLRSDGIAVREIARQLSIDAATVLRDLKTEPTPRSAPPPAPAGNQRAVTHGATSELRLAPLREQHRNALRRDYAFLDDRRLALLADVLARVDSATCYLDAAGGVIGDEQRLDAWPVVDKLDRWASRAWEMLRQIEEERKSRSASPHHALEAHLASIEEVSTAHA
jgi:hypothetical protein